MSAHPTINWLNNPKLKIPIKDQGTRCNCWSIVVADVVGVRNAIGKRVKDRWHLSSQYLMDDYIRQRPENIPRGQRGKMTMDSYHNYPLCTRQALEYVKDQGIPYERDYPYTGTRDRSPKGPKELRKLQKLRKVHISKYSKLGCTSQGSEAKEKVYKALGRGPLIATIDAFGAFIEYQGDRILRLEDLDSSADLFVPDSDDNTDDDSSDDDPRDNSSKDGEPTEDDQGDHDPNEDVDDIEYMSHAIIIVGMDFDANFFYVVNSMGRQWGLNGEGRIDCDLIYDILEPHIEEQPSTNSPKSKSQEREIKRLGKAISRKCVVATGGVVIGAGASERVADSKTCAHDMGCLTTFCETVGQGFTFETMYKIMKEHKNPEVLGEGFSWMVTAVVDFGVSLVKFKDLIDFCKDVVLQSSAAATRNAIMKLIGALPNFIGPDIKGFLSDLKPAVLSTLDTEYEKNPFEISMESIEAVTKILEVAKRVKPTGTVELFGVLIVRLYERNQNLLMAIVFTICGIAYAMRQAVAKAGKGILLDVWQCLRDNKKHMPEGTLITMDLCLANVHLDKMVPHVAAALMDAQVGTEWCRDLFEWLSRQLAGFKDFTGAIQLLKPVATAMTALPSISRDTTEVLDVLLRWFVLRQCESNTSCILKVLKFLPELFGALRNGGYMIPELEAAVFLLCLFEKSGYNIEKVLEKMLEAIRSRNNRMRIKSVDLVAYLLDNYGSVGNKQYWMVTEEDLQEEIKIA